VGALGVLKGMRGRGKRGREPKTQVFSMLAVGEARVAQDSALRFQLCVELRQRHVLHGHPRLRSESGDVTRGVAHNHILRLHAQRRKGNVRGAWCCRGKQVGGGSALGEQHPSGDLIQGKSVDVPYVALASRSKRSVCEGRLQLLLRGRHDAVVWRTNGLQHAGPARGVLCA
jgi:hypothetical protein